MGFWYNLVENWRDVTEMDVIITNKWSGIFFLLCVQEDDSVRIVQMCLERLGFVRK